MQQSDFDVCVPRTVKSSHYLAALALALATCVTSIPCAIGAGATDDAALRRKCAHLIKVKLGIKDTGSVDDLRGVKGVIEMVDQCVANGGKG